MLEKCRGAAPHCLEFMEKHWFRESGSWVPARLPSLALTLLSNWNQQSQTHTPKAALVAATFDPECE